MEIKAVPIASTSVFKVLISVFEGQKRYKISFYDETFPIECSTFEDITSENRIKCKTGKSDGDRNMSRLQVVIDDLTVLSLNRTFKYLPDPTFSLSNKSTKAQQSGGATFTIQGQIFLNGAGLNDYSIHIGLDGSCPITDIAMTFIKCLPPKSVPRTDKADVLVGRIEEYIGDLKYKEDVEILAIVVGVLAVALVTAVVIGVSAVVFKEEKEKSYQRIQNGTDDKGRNDTKASREEFADAQMNIRDINQTLLPQKCHFATTKLMSFISFPNQDITSNPLLHYSEITDAKKTKIQNSMEKFETLLSNKLFLKSLVQTLDRPNMLTMQEKAHFSSVLSISLLGNMRLFFELVHCLLSLSGMQLFMLYKAVQTIIEMAPVDALTANSKKHHCRGKTTSKMRIEHQTIVHFTNRFEWKYDQHYPVKVLDCDTISQISIENFLYLLANSSESEQKVLTSGYSITLVSGSDEGEGYRNAKMAPAKPSHDIKSNKETDFGDIFLNRLFHTKESPPQKLLFHKDIPRYRKLIAPFFVRVEQVNEQEFWSELEEISNVIITLANLRFSGKTPSSILKFIKYVILGAKAFDDSLIKNGPTSSSPVAFDVSSLESNFVVSSSLINGIVNVTPAGILS
ncbi:PLXNA [Mytilus edulis]|uniref:PLXNA n=1 Tax=Mytilus edulis TaxID=6550 RepID=A0A8S3T6Q3_MYTED|nr:PLXNA [Mytilus edulis]